MDRWWTCWFFSHWTISVVSKNLASLQSRDLFWWLPQRSRCFNTGRIKGSLEVTGETPLIDWKGHVNSASQKAHVRLQNCHVQRLPISSQEMWCQRMWMQPLPPSKPSAPSNSWIGAQLASNVASIISRQRWFPAAIWPRSCVLAVWFPTPRSLWSASWVMASKWERNAY